MNKSKLVSGFIIGTFVTLYLMVSIISTIHVIEFFRLSNPEWLAVSLAIAFEVGAAASLASIIALKKMSKSLVWGLFIILTLMQAMGNTYYAFVNLENFQGWIELFDLIDEELIYQKRVLSLISGAILPIVALGFIKSLVDYIKPPEDESTIVSGPTGSNGPSGDSDNDQGGGDQEDSPDETPDKVVEVDGGNSTSESAKVTVNGEGIDDVLKDDENNVSEEKETEDKYEESNEEKPSQGTENVMYSPEHFSGPVNANREDILVSDKNNDPVKRYPENLE